MSQDLIKSSKAHGTLHNAEPFDSSQRLNVGGQDEFKPTDSLTDPD